MDGDAEMKDGSFIEAPASRAEKQSSDGKGKTFDTKVAFPHTVLINTFCFYSLEN